MGFAQSRKTHPLEGSGTWRIVIAAPILLAAFAFGAGGIVAFGRAKTTIDPVTLDNASSLVTDGVFRLTRNPMYVGLTGLLFAWALILGVVWTLIGRVRRWL